MIQLNTIYVMGSIGQYTSACYAGILADRRGPALYVVVRESIVARLMCPQTIAHCSYPLRRWLFYDGFGSLSFDAWSKGDTATSFFYLCPSDRLRHVKLGLRSFVLCSRWVSCA